MDLEELKRYRGVKEMPEDFDAVWDKWLQEANELPLVYRVEKEEVLFRKIIYERLYFYGMHGEEVCCHLLREDREGRKPVLFLFHGYASHSGDIFDKLPYVYNGFIVAAMDVRGQGGESQDHLVTNGTTWQGHIIRGLHEGRENLFFKNVFLDTVVLKRILIGCPYCDEKKMASAGFSQGGALSAVCAALNPEVSLAVIGYPFLSDYRKALQMSKNGAFWAYEELQHFFKTRDPLHENEDNFFAVLDYIDVGFLVKRIRGKVLCFTGLLDELVPVETQFAVFNRIECQKKMFIYPEYGHEQLPKASDIILEELIQRMRDWRRK